MGTWRQEEDKGGGPSHLCGQKCEAPQEWEILLQCPLSWPWGISFCYWQQATLGLMQLSGNARDVLTESAQIRMENSNSDLMSEAWFTRQHF